MWALPRVYACCLLTTFFSSLNHKGPNYRLSKKGERIKAAAEKSHENCVVFKRDEAVFVFHAMVASSQDKCDLVVKKKFSIWLKDTKAQL